MYKKVIVALSLDHGIGQAAIEAARKLLTEGGQIIAVHVYEPPHSSVKTYLTEDAVKGAFLTVRSSMAERIGDQTDIEAVILEGHSGRAITDYAEKTGADCIVVGSHEPGLHDFFLGSTASRVVRHAPCSVHVLR